MGGGAEVRHDLTFCTPARGHEASPELPEGGREEDSRECGMAMKVHLTDSQLPKLPWKEPQLLCSETHPYVCTEASLPPAVPGP